MARTSDDQHRSFNILGRPFQIPLRRLDEYPHTLLADRVRLERYWRVNLHAYFLSRDPQMFERVILPFYLTSHPIKRTSMLSVSESVFRDELDFYDLLEHYRIENVRARVRVRTSVIDLISCVACALGLVELLQRRCQARSLGFLIGDILLSLSLSWMLFTEAKWRRSATFILQVFLASSSFLLTLISYRFTGSWYFILGLSLRHLLLLPLCLPDLCDLLDMLGSSVRRCSSFLSRFVLVLTTVLFLCLWLGLTISISDADAFPSPPTPFRSIYFAYHLLFNVGYGDTSERSVLSFVLIVCLTLLSCPVLLIVFQKFLDQIDFE